MASPVLISERQADYQNTERSTEQTVQEMTRLIRDSIADPEVQRAAASAIAGMGPNSSCVASQIAAAVWAWLKRNIQFVTDEEQLLKLLGRRDELELLISPSVMVRTRPKRGDCDCFTMMGCAMLQCLGVTPLIKTYKCDRQEPWRWAHVCGAALLADGSIFPVDASHGDYPGWEVPAQDTYEFQLWDMGGNRVGAPMRKGLSGYVPQPGWTGSELSTVDGWAAGPYPQTDFLRAYYPGPSRLQGLQGIARGKYGLGATVCDDTGCYDDGTGTSVVIDNPLTGLPLGTSAPVDNSPGANYIDTVTGQLVNGATGQVIPNASVAQYSTASNYSSLASIVSSLAAAGTKLGSQALATPGTTILPNGTIVTGTPAGTSALTAAGISSSTLLLVGGVLFAVLLVESLGKK